MAPVEIQSKSSMDESYQNDTDTIEFLKKFETVSSEENALLLESSPSNRIQIAIGILVRFMLPLYNGVARGLQGIKHLNVVRLLKNIQSSRSLLTNLLAFAANSISMSLSSVQVAHRIDPLLKLMKLRRDNSIYLPHSPSILSGANLFHDDPVEKCLSIKVLAEPEPGQPIRVDVIFIHGLHGSLVNTWKQGLWNSKTPTVNFKRPPRPPRRPPKRPRRSRSQLLQPPHLSKRARVSISSDPIDLEFTSNTFVAADEMLDIDGSGFDAAAAAATTEWYDSDEELSQDELEHLKILDAFSTFRSRIDHSDNSDEEGFQDNFNARFHEQHNDDRHEPLTDDNYSACWPGDWLPADCPGVRVIALNYTTDPYLWRPMWIRKRNRSAIVERSREMMDLLMELGVGRGHPIVWVGHSKGGLFVKQMIVDAWEGGKSMYAPIWKSSRGCLFYSVPHRGSPLADFNLPLLRQSVELTEIQKDCSYVLELHKRFVALYRSGHLKIQVFSFVETALTLMSVLYLRIVSIESADPGIGDVCGIHLDHRQICKPRNRKCILYTELTKMINNIS